jgi:hypothetical protein
MNLNEQTPEFQRGYAWGKHNEMLSILEMAKGLLKTAPKEDAQGIKRLIAELEIR